MFSPFKKNSMTFRLQITLIQPMSTCTPYLFPSSPVQCGRLSGHRHPLHPQSFFSFWRAYIVVIVIVAFAADMSWVQTVLWSSIGTFLLGCVSPHLKESTGRFSENNLSSVRWIKYDSIHQKRSCSYPPLHTVHLHHQDRLNLSVIFGKVRNTWVSLKARAGQEITGNVTLYLLCTRRLHGHSSRAPSRNRACTQWFSLSLSFLKHSP